jgi:hypothetical protein
MLYMVVMKATDSPMFDIAAAPSEKPGLLSRQKYAAAQNNTIAAVYFLILLWHCNEFDVLTNEKTWKGNG